MTAPRKLKSATVLAAAAAAAAAPEVAIAAPTSHSGHDAPAITGHVWKNKKTGRYLTVLNGSTANGAEIKTNDTNGQAQQRWSNLLHSNGLYSLRNHNSAKCMAALGPTTNYDIDQYSCTTSRRFFGIYTRKDSHGNFLGSVIIPGGGTSSVQGHLCEDTTNHSISNVVSFPARPSNIPKRCLWSTFTP
jgi:Ricin-type beta-trefoil lectin domain-like